MSSTTSSEPKKPKKGILKKPTTSTPAVAAPAAATPISLPVAEHKPEPEKKPTPTAREAAIQQALVIQQQFELEDRVQDTIIELAKFPLSPHTPSASPDKSNLPNHHDASNPSPEDSSRFRQLVSLLQPGDYEDLIEERNTLNKCGYALCPNRRLKLGKGGEYKLVGYGRRDFGIVPRRELERWCTRTCARRAMYVKVQLAEVAAAARAGLPAVGVELLDESTGSTTDQNNQNYGTKQLADGVQDSEIEDKKRKAAQDAKNLALERGDTKAGKPSEGLVTLAIREKSVTKDVQKPSLAKDGESHLVLDGYKTRFDPKTLTSQRMTDDNITTMAEDALEDLFG